MDVAQTEARRLQDAFEVAKIEWERIRDLIDTVFLETPDRQEAEKIVMEVYAQAMEEATTGAKETFHAWMEEGSKLFPEEVGELLAV